MDQGQLTHRGTIYPWQCDHMGHMNVMWYSGKFDEASWQILASLGLTSPRFRKEGMRMAAVEQRIEYKRELQAGDTVTIRSRVLEVGNRSIRFSHEMNNDETGETAAISVIAGVYFNAKTKMALPLPEDVRERALAALNGLESGPGEDLPSSLQAAMG